MVKKSQNIVLIFFLSLLLTATFQANAIAEKTISATDLFDKLRGMWLGQLIGNATGRQYEGLYEISPNPASYVPWVIKKIWDSDDDTDIEYVTIHILETHGFNCNYQDIADQWLTHIKPSTIYIANNQAWHLMYDGHLPPDTGSQAYNEHWYSIDSQISTETLGAISPAMPQTAINLAGKFARITNSGFPVHAAQFYAAIYANAFFEPNVVTLVVDGLNAIPKTSRTHQVISDVLNWYIQDSNDGILNWRETRAKIYDKYQGKNSYGRYYHWTESTVNTAATVLAILYGQSDFKETTQIAVLAGWDSDCNPATAAGLIGIIKGFSNLPHDLIDPNICGGIYKNVSRPYLPNPNSPLPQYDSITHIAIRLTILAEKNILANGGYLKSNGLTRTYHIPDVNILVNEPEKPDPTGPRGLVADALTKDIHVTPTAAIQRFNTNNDRENLYSIIDGITDNSYNGHKPYYSYTSNTKERPKQDWYQLNFSKPVKFEKLTFYEGDIIWNRINEYYKDDFAKGGFFEDLTVEILRNGKYIVPANLKMSPDLDRFRMYQTIIFSFAPTVGDAIRIIGTPDGTQLFTTIMELEAHGNIDPGLYICEVRIANGKIQRSSINNIKIKFSCDVAVKKDDIELVGTKNLGKIDLKNVWFLYNKPFKLLTIYILSPLPDDVYKLRLNCGTITDVTGQPLLDDDQNPDDGYYTIGFHKLFGDADGSGVVDYSDFSIFASHWLNSPADTGLDSNGDDIIGHIDLSAFAENWLTSF